MIFPPFFFIERHAMPRHAIADADDATPPLLDFTPPAAAMTCRPPLPPRRGFRRSFRQLIDAD